MNSVPSPFPQITEHLGIGLAPVTLLLLLVAVPVVVAIITAAFVAKRSKNRGSEASAGKVIATGLAAILITGAAAVAVVLLMFISVPRSATSRPAITYHRTVHPHSPKAVRVEINSPGSSVELAVPDGRIDQDRSSSSTSIIASAESENRAAAASGEPPSQSSSIVVEADTGDATESADASSEVPRWVNGPKVIPVGDSKLEVINGGQFATVEEAQADAIQLAASMLSKQLPPPTSWTGDWTISEDLLLRHAIRDRYVETRQVNFGTVTAPMHRVHLQLRLSPDLPPEIQDVRRAAIVNHRLWFLSAAAGLVTLLLATTSAAFRLDASTAGAYRGRLTLAATSVVGIGGAVVALFV